MDYNMLREVDWDTVKPGDLLIEYYDVDLDVTYWAGPDMYGAVCVQHGERLSLRSREILRLSPLTWLEGKPVYPGDMVYHKLYGNVMVDAGHPLDLSACSWEKPKVKPKVKRKGWINLYRNPNGKVKVSPNVAPTKECADNLAGLVESERIACIEAEWEE